MKLTPNNMVDPKKYEIDSKKYAKNMKLVKFTRPKFPGSSSKGKKNYLKTYKITNISSLWRRIGNKPARYE